MTSAITVSLPTGPLRDRVGALPPSVSLLEWSLDSVAPASDIDLVVMPLSHDQQAFDRLDGVRARLVQSQSIGYDNIWLPPGTVFANAASVHETSTAELALALALAAQRQIPRFVRDAMEGESRPIVTGTLADSVVLLVGYGGVGSAIHRRLEPFETTVVRVARTAREDSFGTVHPMTALPALLPDADIVIVSLPLTAETHHLVDDRFLSGMRDGALLVNVGRGPTVDTTALLDHLARGRVRAALDVTDPEPLPVGHPLFADPNVLITPHVGGGSTTAGLPRMARLVRRQIDLMLNGEPPVNVVMRT